MQSEEQRIEAQEREGLSVEVEGLLRDCYTAIAVLSKAETQQACNDALLLRIKQVLSGDTVAARSAFDDALEEQALRGLLASAQLRLKRSHKLLQDLLNLVTSTSISEAIEDKISEHEDLLAGDQEAIADLLAECEAELDLANIAPSKTNGGEA